MSETFDIVQISALLVCLCKIRKFTLGIIKLKTADLFY